MQLKRGVVLEEQSANLLKLLYKDEFPNIISTILRLKHSNRIVDNMNGRFLGLSSKYLIKKQSWSLFSRDQRKNTHRTSSKATDRSWRQLYSGISSFANSIKS